METKVCKKCGRELPLDTDHFYKNCGHKDGYLNVCKECKGRKFTKYLTQKEGYIFCKKCNRELPHTIQYFPEDKNGTKSGLRNICRECNPSYGRFLNDGEFPHKEWTKEEEVLLSKFYKDYTGKELHELYFPNRSIRSIECHASELGLQGKSEIAIEKANKSRSEIISATRPGIKMSDEAKENMSKAKIEYYKTHTSWAKGAIFTEEHRRHISEAKIKAGKWKGEDNPRHKHPLNGKENGRWKGGILDTYIELRSETKDWFDESARFCNYKCVVTGGEFDNIHHTTAFRDIVDKVFDITGIEIKSKVCDYKNEEFSILRTELKALHNNYGYGACLNKDVHKLFHDNYGYTKFSPYNFLDFIYKIDTGEFDKWFLDNNLKININYDYINYLESTILNLKMSA